MYASVCPCPLLPGVQNFLYLPNHMNPPEFSGYGRLTQQPFQSGHRAVNRAVLGDAAKRIEIADSGCVVADQTGGQRRGRSGGQQHMIVEVHAQLNGFPGHGGIVVHMEPVVTVKRPGIAGMLFDEQIVLPHQPGHLFHHCIFPNRNPAFKISYAGEENILLWIRVSGGINLENFRENLPQRAVGGNLLNPYRTQFAVLQLRIEAVEVLRPLWKVGFAQQFAQGKDGFHMRLQK